MDRATIKRIGKDNVRKQWGELLLALVLVEAANTVAALLTVGVGSLVVTGPLDFGLTYLYYMQTQGEQPGQMMLLEGFKKKFGDSFLAGLLVGLIQMIPALIGAILLIGRLISILGAFALLTNGSYSSYSNYNAGFSIGAFLMFIVTIVLTAACLYIMYGICMSMYILVREQDKTAVGAIKKSWAMTKGQKGRLFVFDLSYIGWGILCCLTFGILLIWVAPYYRSARTVLFNDIYANSHVADNPDFSFRSEFNDIKGMASNMKMPGRNNQEAGNAPYSAPADYTAPAGYTAPADYAAPAGFAATQAAPMAPEAPVAPEAPAAPETPAAPEAPVQPAPGMKFCKHCGAQISEGAMFCNKCGGQQ